MQSRNRKKGVSFWARRCGLDTFVPKKCPSSLNSLCKTRADLGLDSFQSRFKQSLIRQHREKYVKKSKFSSPAPHFLNTPFFCWFKAGFFFTPKSRRPRGGLAEGKIGRIQSSGENKPGCAADTLARGFAWRGVTWKFLFFSPMRPWKWRVKVKLIQHGVL